MVKHPWLSILPCSFAGITGFCFCFIVFEEGYTFPVCIFMGDVPNLFITIRCPYPPSLILNAEPFMEMCVSMWMYMQGLKSNGEYLSQLLITYIFETDLLTEPRAQQFSWGSLPETSRAPPASLSRVGITDSQHSAGSLDGCWWSRLGPHASVATTWLIYPPRPKTLFNGPLGTSSV